jgi:acetyl-CoA C-acetyltransferase
MSKAFIYDAVRTPRGKKKNGALHEITALSLAAQQLEAIRDRNGLDTSLVDDVILGCVTPVGEQGACIARAAVLAADYAQSTPGVQINRFCASGLEAVNMAAAKVASGEADFAIGGGVESMTRVPMGSDGGALMADPALTYDHNVVPQGVSADLIATKFGYSRDDVDAFAMESQKRAARAWKGKRFRKSIVPVRNQLGLVQLDHDEHMRPETDMQSLGALKSAFKDLAEFVGLDAIALQKYPEVERIDWVHTAGNSSGIVDGASAVLVGSKKAGERAGLKPRARIVAAAAIGSEPTIMLTGPVSVTQKVLKKARMKPTDIDLWEINEAFASVVLYYIDSFGLDPKRVNPNGGAIAMGHPLGATGAMVLGTLLDEMERSGKSTGLVTLCVGAGMGAATIIELV